MNSTQSAVTYWWAWKSDTAPEVIAGYEHDTAESIAQMFARKHRIAPNTNLWVVPYATVAELRTQPATVVAIGKATPS
jgi:type III secretion system FlhB-like substrate exporter